jgi:predicted membrane protein
MNEKLIAAIVITVGALPTLGMGLACITRRWMPEQYAKSHNCAQLQIILGLGMLGISMSLIVFSLLMLLLSNEVLSWMTTVFLVAINMEAIVMVALLHRTSKKTP